MGKLLEGHGGETLTFEVEADLRVESEVAAMFRDHPYLLVSESRLASLLCRPLEMVRGAVARLEEKGILARKDEDTILCTEDYMADMLCE
jgi:hypothetical protein